MVLNALQSILCILIQNFEDFAIILSLIHGLHSGHKRQFISLLLSTITCRLLESDFFIFTLSDLRDTNKSG